MKTHLSISQLKQFTTCPYKWYYGYGEGIEIIDEHRSQALHMGKWWDSFVGMRHGEDVEPDDTYLNDTPKAKCYALANVADNMIDWSAMPQVRQVKVDMPIANSNRYDSIIGFLDGYDDVAKTIYEDKLSSDGYRYHRFETIELQVGTYFLGMPEAERCILRAVSLPSQRLSAKQDGDSYIAYQNRLEKEIAGNVSQYFLNYDFAQRTYGRIFWRADFDLSRTQAQIDAVARAIDFCCDTHTFWANTENCDMFSGCDYFDICRKNVYNYDIYKKKEAEE